MHFQPLLGLVGVLLVLARPLAVANAGSDEPTGEEPDPAWVSVAAEERHAATAAVDEAGYGWAWRLNTPLLPVAGATALTARFRPTIMQGVSKRLDLVGLLD